MKLRAQPPPLAEDDRAPPAQGGRERRAVALIIVALLLLSAFVAVAPALSSELRRGYAFVSGLVGEGGGSSPSQGESGFVTSTNCSGVVTIQPLSSPNINGSSASISYPPDYCTLAEYALAQINADRAANGTGPVSLDFNRAAQQHADSMLYYGYFSHYDVQGYAPYMRYSLLGGLGGDFENVAYFSYSAPHFTTTSAVEQGIQFLEHSMVYDDASCCNNGHRDNILDPQHNFVSIGVAYNSTHVFFDEEFENDYINLTFSASGPGSPSPYEVTMKGSPIPGTQTPNSIYIAYDPTPSAKTPSYLNNTPHEYGPGTLIGGVLPPAPFAGCAQFTTGITECAESWVFTSSEVDIVFSLQPFVRQYGPGVYTIYLITGATTDSALTSISVFVS